MKATVTVMLKPGVLDCRGRRSRTRWARRGSPVVKDGRAGKVIEIELAEADPEKARAMAEEIRKLLANTVIESFRVVVAE